MSGKRGSNPRPPAWKASALSTELFPHYFLILEVGGDGFEPPKSKDNRFTVCPIWPLWKPPSMFSLLLSLPSRASCRIRTNDPEITNHVLWPTELKRLALSIRSPVLESYNRKADAKVGIIFELPKLFGLFFIYFSIFP